MEELQAKWAPNIVIGLGRLGGRSVGVVANNPLRLGGCLDSTSAEKASRFVRMCDAFGIPLLVVVDVPGYLPGVGQEWDGVVRRGAKLLHAFAEAVVPRVTLVTRKAYGGAYIAMNSKALGATAVFAWPDAEIAVMGAKAAVGILHRRKLAAAPDDEREALHAELAERAREDRRRGAAGRRARRRRRGDHPGADPPAGRRGTRLRAGRARRARQHPALIRRSALPSQPRRPPAPLAYMAARGPDYRVRGSPYQHGRPGVHSQPRGPRRRSPRARPTRRRPAGAVRCGRSRAAAPAPGPRPAATGPPPTRRTPPHATMPSRAATGSCGISARS